MRKPSRMMPPASPPAPAGNGWEAAFAALGLSLVAALVLLVLPIVLIVFVPIALVGRLLGLPMFSDNLERLASEREGESICTFARSFPRRSVDTWILRAVFEEFQPYCPLGDGATFPLRATDRIFEDLAMDGEDIEDIVVAAADRSGRSLDSYKRNPYYGRVESVVDVVRFLAHQPPSPAGLALRPELGGAR